MPQSRKSMYRCNLCRKTFMSPDEVSHHRRNDAEHLERKSSKSNVTQTKARAKVINKTKMNVVVESQSMLANPVILCGLCKTPFTHDDLVEIRRHLSSHVASIRGSHRCEVCNLGFLHADDLQLHHTHAAQNRDCGFEFPHAHSCRGHHAPSLQADKMLDRAEFVSRLRERESRRMEAFRLSIVGLMRVLNQRKQEQGQDEAGTKAGIEQKQKAQDTAKEDEMMKRLRALNRVVGLYEKAGYTRPQIADMLRQLTEEA